MRQAVDQDHHVGLSHGDGEHGWEICTVLASRVFYGEADNRHVSGDKTEGSRVHLLQGPTARGRGDVIEESLYDGGLAHTLGAKEEETTCYVTL